MVRLVCIESYNDLVCFSRTFSKSQKTGKLLDAYLFTAALPYRDSMKPNNTKELLAQPDIDSRLIGRASLKATDLAGIIAVSKYNCIPCFGLAQCAYYLFGLEDKSEMRE